MRGIASAPFGHAARSSTLRPCPQGRARQIEPQGATMQPLSLVLGFLTIALMLRPTHAQAPADFYKGKTIDLYIGTSVGGGYDAYGRMLARHMSRYMPGNPTIVPKNMEGGGGMRLANFLYNAAPKDGTTFAIFNRGTAFDPLLGS